MHGEIVCIIANLKYFFFNYFLNLGLFDMLIDRNVTYEILYKACNFGDFSPNLKQPILNCCQMEESQNCGKCTSDNISIGCNGAVLDICDFRGDR